MKLELTKEQVVQLANSGGLDGLKPETIVAQWIIQELEEKDIYFTHDNIFNANYELVAIGLNSSIKLISVKNQIDRLVR